MRGYSSYSKVEVGFTAAEFHPKTGLLATNSSDGYIYIWSRLKNLFKNGADPMWTPPLIKIKTCGKYHNSSLTLFKKTNLFYIYIKENLLFF